MARIKLVNGVEFPFSAAEESERDAEEKAWADAAPERAMASLRKKRNRRLTETDWWVMRGSMTDAQTAYRQALRDLPANTADPANPTWPVEPA